MVVKLYTRIVQKGEVVRTTWLTNARLLLQPTMEETLLFFMSKHPYSLK